MSFIISRGYAEVQILKTSESDPLSFWNILTCISWTEWNILIDFCINIDIDKI